MMTSTRDDRVLTSVDWAQTDLGAIATWPSPLATIVDVLTTAAVPMLLWWGEHGIQIHNDAARRELLNAWHPGALGAPASEIWGVVWPQLQPAVTSARAGGAMMVEHLVLGDQRTWSFALSPVPDGMGGIGGVLVIARETTPNESFVAAFREHLRALFLHAPTPIAILRGPRFIVEVASKAMTNAFEVVPSEVLGRPALDVVPDARRFGPLLDHIVTTGETRVLKELEYRTEVTDEGKTVGRYANALFAPIRGVKDGIEGVLVIAAEITDEVRAREENRRLRGDAEAANRAKDEFLAMLGHELRNPLSPISTALQVMRMRGITGRELEVIERQVRHLTRLVDDLLDVSRAIGGKIELHRRDLELSEVVAGALEVSSPLLEQRQQTVEVEVPRKGLCVHADRERMIQVVSNLVTNAAKYSDHGSRITIRGSRCDGTVRLQIRDHGAGIEPAMLGRVFDAFVQQPQTIDRARGGLGLGLAIVRSLVELHGGRVSASSEGRGRGSEFTIELPAVSPANETTPGARPAETSEAPVTLHRRVLIVDDNEDAARMLGDALEELGYEVALAYDGPSALRLAVDFQPDVALLDLGLPAMDGFEVAERLRVQQATHCPHLVAVTGYGQDSDRQRSLRAGFERHLVKPVDLGVLSGVVAELVAPHHGASH